MQGMAGRTSRVWIASIILIGGCAMQPARGTLPQRYDCGGWTAVGTDTKLAVDGRMATPAATEAEGMRFVVFRGDEVVEYVVPPDPRLDLMTATYSASNPEDRTTWKLQARGRCVAHAGFSDALARFIAGETTEEIAAELDLPRPEAERLIHGAIAYYRARLEY